MVDLVTKNWNQIHLWIFEGSEAVLGLGEPKAGLVYAK
jgi:hypothetical protein